MWKIFAGFIVFAALAMFIVFKGGSKLDMAGEAAGHSEESASATASAPAAAAAPAEASAPAAAAAEASASMSAAGTTVVGAPK